ncbi:MAG TPA: neutral/alkaline non-lysosomal ceramidase N-terminal domain-containing protein [Planctomycetota bacterium]|nr:neutral/alkaline non-lysosomal ceramidase N-terminal domain-containing protein [Planctomycetota bacterium]
MLMCGAAKAVINPPLPAVLAGYLPRTATKVHDDLHVAAIYLKQGPDPVLLLTYDTIAIHAGFCDEVQAAVHAETGIPLRNIFLTCSHTHSSPRVGVTPEAVKAAPKERRKEMEQLAKYHQRVVVGSVEAARDAKKSAEPANVFYNTTRIRENLNRRAFFPSGQYFYQPKQKNLLPLCDGIVDDELAVIFFKATKEERFIATLVNYTAHPLCIGDSSNEVSADYPGVLKAEIERNLGGTALFVNGACGDNHPLGAEAGLARAERMGLALAEKALYHRWDAVMLDNTTLSACYKEIGLPPMTEADFEALPKNFASDWRSRGNIVDGQVRTFISLWAVGPLLFCGVPGELSAELGLRLKWESAFPKTFVMFIATDNLGYISHRNAYQWGGYEVLTSALGPNGGKNLVGEILAAAEELKIRFEKVTGKNLHLPGALEGAVPANAPGAAKK